MRCTLTKLSVIASPTETDARPRIMNYELLRYGVEDRVAVISYDRQERRNAWSLAMVREVMAAVRQANADDDVGAIVLTHEGPIFCAGSDVKDGPHPRDPHTGVRPNMATESMAEGDSWPKLISESKPFVAAVDGPAFGAGATQLLSADLRIVGESALFSFPFMEFKAMPELGSTGLLARLIGFGRACEIIYLSKKISAREALDIGLVNEVVPDGVARDRAMEVARQLAAIPPLQFKLTKGLMYANFAEPDPDRMVVNEMAAFRTLLKALKAERGGESDGSMLKGYAPVKVAGNN